MIPEKPSAEDRERPEAAAAWWMRLEEDEAAVFSAEFREWIGDPANEREFLAIERAMKTLGEGATSPAIAGMRQSARRWFENLGADKPPPRRFSSKPVYAMAAAAALVAVVAGACFLWFAARPLSYETALGERRPVALEDGSRILLDSGSEVDIHYSKTARAVTLTRGRARFDVAHDKARPFSVTAAAETVIAVGTSFDVELRGSKVLVTLIEGHVLIRGAADDVQRGRGAAPIALSAGQQLIVSADRKPAVAPVDFAVTQAWEAGHLVFRGERLDDAAEQINHYTNHPITVDPSAASFRVSGVFNTGDSKSFVSAATGLYPVEAVSDADGAITLRRSP